MTLRVALVDDEPLAIERLRLGLGAIPGVEVVATAGNASEALMAIARHQPDLVILDIQMPGGTGLDIARALERTEHRPEVIFATAFDRHAPEAFEVDASDYLLKPVRIERLRMAMDRARRRLAARHDGQRVRELEEVVDALRAGAPDPTAGTYEAELWAPRAGGLTRVPVEAIQWIEAARDYVLIHTANRSFIIRETMAALGARLDPRLIVRAHCSAFVNRAAVASVERIGRGGLRLTLPGGAEIAVGMSYRDGVLAALGTQIPGVKPARAEV